MARNLADITNQNLARAGYLTEVDHRSYADQTTDYSRAFTRVARSHSYADKAFIPKSA